jgi:hypothetical protein
MSEPLAGATRFVPIYKSTNKATSATASVECVFRYRFKCFPVGTQLHFFEPPL